MPGKTPTGNPVGRPRKPTALKMLHGDDKVHPERINHEEPGLDVEFGEPDVPEGLSEAQGKVWLDVTRHLRLMKLLHAPDAPTVLAYVVIVEKCDRLRIKMTNEPEVVRNPNNGMPMQNPVFDQWLKAVTKMEALSNKLGLNPQSRSIIRTKNAAAAPPAQKGPDASPERLFG